jgi:multidrug efflux system outer membrane protein
MRRILLLTTVCIAPLLVAGCANRFNYPAEPLSLPEMWKTLTEKPHPQITENPDAKPEATWWEAFNDPILTRLVQQALANNHDVKIAEQRIREARADRTAGRGLLFPRLDVTGRGLRENQGLMTNDKAATLFETGFDASWELDLFGANQRRVDALDALFSARNSARDGIMLSLAAEVSRNYLELRNQQNQIRITEDTIRAQRDTLQLAQSRRQAGLSSELESSQANSQLLATQARLPTLEASVSASMNRLAVLCGVVPGTLDTELKLPAPVPVAALGTVLGTPSEVLSRRSDIQIAQKNLVASTALKEAAIADLYPKVSLSSLFGLQYNSRFDGGGIWSIGAGVAAPIFNFGRLQSAVDASDARKAQAVESYKEIVLLALEEVENALTNYLHEEDRRSMLARTAESNAQTVALATERYTRGISDFTDVLLAQTALYETQRALADSETAVSKNLVALYKSLGTAGYAATNAN